MDIVNVGIEVQIERQVECSIRNQIALNSGPLTGTTVAIYHILHVTSQAEGVLIVTPNTSGMVGGQVIPSLSVINLDIIFLLGIRLNRLLLNINLACADQERQLDGFAPRKRYVLPAEAHTTVVVTALFHEEFIGHIVIKRSIIT